MIPEFEKICDIYEKAALDCSWVRKNSFVIQSASRNNMCVAGSFAIGLATKNPFKIPGDLDFVSESVPDALLFLNELMTFLSGKSVFYRLTCNNNNDYTAPGSNVHFRFFCPFWKEICVMIIPKANYYYWKGLRIQPYGEVRWAMERIEEKSPKGRIQYDAIQDDVDDIFETTGEFTVKQQNIDHTY